MKTTLRDVAEKAGVSAMAVSAVLHGTGRNVKISEEKAEIIRRVAQELRYQPNHVARSLRYRRTNSVGIVLQHFDRFSSRNPYFPTLFNGIMAALFPADYTFALCPRLVQKSERGAIFDGRFDGVLWCRPDFTEESLNELRRSSTPVVMLHAPPGSAPGVPTFCADNLGAMRQVVQHLTGLGHRRIGFVIDPLDHKTMEGQDRSLAFERAMKEVGLEGEVLIWQLDAPELSAYATADRPHTALATYSDFVAGQILKAATKFGIQVPEDLSVVGFDSTEFCEFTIPRLTSVNQPVEKIAFEATKHLLALIQASDATNPVTLPDTSVYACGFDIRESTAAPFRP